jgi:hypothetical protein
MLCALASLALRGTSGGATMYPPVGRAHRYVHMCRKGTRARLTGFYHRAGVSSDYFAPAFSTLCLGPLQSVTGPVAVADSQHLGMQRG